MLALVALSTLGTGCFVGYPCELASRGFHAVTADSNSEIHEAARDGNLQKVAALIKDNPDLVRARGEEGKTPLHFAAGMGHTEVVRFLLDHKADVNAKDLGRAVRSFNQYTLYEVTEFLQSQRTALHYAAEYGHADIVELLLAHGAAVNVKDHDGITPLRLAAHEGSARNDKGSARCVKLLLAHNADVSSEASIMVGISNVDVARMLLERKADMTGALHSAVTISKAEYRKPTVELLFTYGADVNAIWNGKTALHSAAECGHAADVIEILVAKGANVNATNIYTGMTPLQCAVEGHYHPDPATAAALLACKADVNFMGDQKEPPLHMAATARLAEMLLDHGANIALKGRWGGTALHRAASSSRCTDVTEVLIKRGADIEVKDDRGETPLHEAAEFGNTGGVKILLAHKANIEARDNAGRTPLHLMASHWTNLCDCADLLLANGADVNARDNNGETPLHEAAKARCIKIFDVLIAHNADINAKDKNGKTPLWFAEQNRFAEGATVLRTHGAKR